MSVISEIGRVTFNTDDEVNGVTAICNLVRDYDLDGKPIYQVQTRLIHTRYGVGTTLIDSGTYRLEVLVTLNDPENPPYSIGGVLLKSSDKDVWNDIYSEEPEFTGGVFNLDADDSDPYISFRIERTGGNQASQLKFVSKTYAYRTPVSPKFTTNGTTILNSLNRSVSESFVVRPMASQYDTLVSYGLIFRDSNGNIIPAGTDSSKPIYLSKDVTSSYTEFSIRYNPSLFTMYPELVNRNVFPLTASFVMTFGDPGEVNIEGPSITANVYRTEQPPIIHSLELSIINDNDIIRDSWGNVAVESYSSIQWTANTSVDIRRTLSKYKVNVQVRRDGSMILDTTYTIDNVYPGEYSARIDELVGGQYTITIIAVDDTGVEVSSPSVGVYVNPYDTPALSSPQIYRSDANKIYQPSSGSYFTVYSNADYSPVGANNHITLTYLWRKVETPEAAYSDPTVFVRNTQTLSNDTIDKDLAYDIKLVATDTLGNTGIYEYRIPSGIITMHLKQGGEAISFGMYCNPSDSKIIRSAWPISSVGGFKMDATALKFPGKNIGPSPFAYAYSTDGAKTTAYINIRTPGNYLICAMYPGYKHTDNIYAPYLVATPDMSEPKNVGTFVSIDTCNPNHGAAWPQYTQSWSPTELAIMRLDEGCYKIHPVWYRYNPDRAVVPYEEAGTIIFAIAIDDYLGATHDI